MLEHFTATKQLIPGKFVDANSTNSILTHRPLTPITLHQRAPSQTRSSLFISKLKALDLPFRIKTNYESASKANKMHKPRPQLVSGKLPLCFERGRILGPGLVLQDWLM